MAIRKILTGEDETLHAVCKPVEKFDEKLAQLLDDMHETLEKAQGVGLAAPQIGIRRRIFIMHVDDEKIEAINPQILKTRGKQKVKRNGKARLYENIELGYAEPMLLSLVMSLLGLLYLCALYLLV